MPTENRSSNTEMVSVPRELLQKIDRMYTDGMNIYGECEDLRALLAQHQGEPVGMLLIDEYFDNREVGDVDVQLDLKVCGQLAEKYPGQSLPLYTHADTGEVERQRAELTEQGLMVASESRRALRAEQERDTLRAKLAERDALLRDIQAAMREYEQGCDQFPPFHHNQLMERISAALSASAEPSEREAQALQAEKLLGIERLPVEQMAPVERDERAEFDNWYENKPKSRPFSTVNIRDKCREAWQARAALERKP